MTDTELIDKLDEEIFGENRIEFFYEDGGLIIVENCRDGRNVYVGATIREALEDLAARRTA